ncbi:MAG: phage baseplate assembly protein [Novosphingobium sp.]|nr:phage baseplate assembly protein [Novosphingobium sp.]
MRTGDDLPDQIGEMIRFGRVAEVDLAAGRCVVVAGDVSTAPIRWIELRAGATRTWSPPSVGEQVLLFCAEGDIAGAVALRGIACSAFPPAGDSLREILGMWDDGSELAYDPEAHAFTLQLCDGATLRIVAPAGATIAANVAIEGDLSVTGDVTADGDVLAGSISLKTHPHGLVKAGTDQSGGPLP